MERHNTRLTTLDSLRGIAAISVAFYHISAVAFEHCDGPIIQFLYHLFRFGNLGVAIFFAISGFVISATLLNQNVTFGYFGKFLFKRSLRLDPNYWASILLDIALTIAAIKMMIPNAGLPSLEKVGLHLLYAQDLTGVGNIASIYWTLCLEVQFYIVFCLCLALRRSAWLLAAVTLYSMFVSAQLVPVPLPGLFVSYWSLFVIGAAAYYWGVKAFWNDWAFPAFLIAMLAVAGFQIELIGFRYALSLLLACAAAALFYVGARKGKLSTWLNSKTLLYLGSRSYSIYLFHTIIGERVVKILVVIAGKLGIPIDGQLWALFALGAGIVASLVVAEIAFRVIEMPSMLLSKRVGAQKKMPALACAA